MNSYFIYNFDWATSHNVCVFFYFNNILMSENEFYFY